MQDCASSNKIKENKYKILRMSLLLGADANNQETLHNFEDASRDIDAMNDEVYLREIENKFYDTLKLEEEEKKLAVLVDYIGGRVEQRISLLSDFANVTGYDLQGLPPIKYYDKLDDYKERLKYIREYLSNIEQINKLDLEIEEADTRLNEAYVQKGTSEEQNIKNEELLQTKFNNIIKNMDFFKEITEENIAEKLNETIYRVEDSKKSLDIFTKSFTTLSGSGISIEEEQEYLSYVEGAEEAFYKNKEEEYLLKIYNLLREKQSEYSNLVLKREELNDILFERINLRKELKVASPDILSNIYDLLEKQYEDLKRQSANMEKIENLTEEINLKKEKLNDLMSENQKVEILSLLREFCIIDTYEEEISTKEESISEISINEEISNDEFIVSENNDDINIAPIAPTISEENDVIEEEKEPEIDNTTLEINQSDLFKEENISQPAQADVTEKVEEEIKENEVINIEEPSNIDLELIHSKANKVMKRVGDMLGIKTEEEKIVTVSNEQETNPMFNIEEEPPMPSKEVETKEVESKEVGSKEPEETPKLNEFENPLFSDNLENTLNLNIDPEFKKSIEPIDPEGDNSDFWFPSDTPDALNELPDLEVPNNNNLFLNNNMPDLQFPDLKIDFGISESEDK